MGIVKEFCQDRDEIVVAVQDIACSGVPSKAKR
jgi:hypothetical protein